MKKFVSMFLTLAMCLTLSAPAWAVEESPNYITELEAVELARWFIANDIYENGNNGWSENTTIKEVIEGTDYYKESYIIYLSARQKSNGYIVVSQNIATALIKEFAYEGEPFLMGVSLPSTSKKSASFANSGTNVRFDQTDENLEFLNKVRGQLDQGGIAPLSYGNITNVYEDINKKYGSGWTMSSIRAVSGFGLLDMDDFNADMHCSLTSLTAIFRYHQINGYTKIESDKNILFETIKTIATQNGYYTPETGTYPWYIDNLATDVWAHYGYIGKGNNDFVFIGIDSLTSTLQKEVDEKRPGTISFTSGSYGGHTVTFYGYIWYKKEGQKNKMYLMVNDNWSTSPRYVDTTHIGELGETLFEICRVLPE